MQKHQALLQRLFDYDPITGEFTFKVQRGPCAPGTKAGSNNGHGYIRINFNGKLRLRSHLAWLYMTGEWPTEQIDHKNGDRTDDSFKNLRQATQAMNQQNMRGPKKGNKSGYLGVCEGQGGLWRATITVNGFQNHLGEYETPLLAHEAYLAAKRIHHEGNLL